MPASQLSDAASLARCHSSGTCSRPTCSPSSPLRWAATRDLGWRACSASWSGASRWRSRPSTPRRGWAFPSASTTTPGATRGSGAVHRQRAVLRLAVVPVPRLRVLLPRARGSLGPRRSPAVTLLAGRPHDAARRRDRSRSRCGAIAGSSAGSSTTRRRASTSACPLSNFAGWLIVGVGDGGRLSALTAAGRSRPDVAPAPGGIALYYGVLVFNLGDDRRGSASGRSLALGIVIHAAVFLLLL